MNSDGEIGDGGNWGMGATPAVVLIEELSAER
jgi:hypothetical protein